MLPPRDGWAIMDIDVPKGSIVYVEMANGDVAPRSFRHIRIMTEQPSKPVTSALVRACPECYTLVQYHCYHDGAEVGSIEMHEDVRREKRQDYLKYEIEEIEERLVNRHQEYYELAPDQYELEQGEKHYEDPH